MDTMLSIDQPYTLLLVFAAVWPAILAIAVLKHRPNLGTRSFSVLMAAVSLWAFVSLFEVCSHDPRTKIFSYQIKYLFIVLVPVSWLTFCLYYSNRLRKLKQSHLAMLLIMPAAILLGVATNPHHHLIFTRFDFKEVGNYYLVVPHFGPLFWLHTAYNYGLMAAGYLFLARHLVDYPGHYRRQVAYLMIGALIPWVANVLYIFNVGELSDFDFTAAAFSISAWAFVWGIMRYQLLDIIPIARDVIITNMNDGVVVFDNKNRIIDLNETARSFSQLNTANVIGAYADQTIPWWNELQKRLPSGRVEGRHTLELNLGEQTRLVQFNQSPLFDNDKRLGSMLILHDVTDAQMAKRAMRQSEERFKSLSENAPEIIFSLDESGALDYVNPAWKKLLGHTREEVIGLPLTAFTPETHNMDIHQTFDQLIAGRLQTAELNLPLVHKNKAQRLFDTSVSVNSNMEGRVTGLIGLAKDVTEEKRLQQQLFQSQKMEAIGTLAGGIAHDFNNLLMGVQANLSLLRLEIGQSTAVSSKLRRIENQIKNGASLTRQLLGYARKGKYAVTVFDINPLIEDTLNVVRRTNKKIVVKSRLAQKQLYIRADQGQIELVLLNLFLNAVDAMPDGGELTVSSSIKDAPDSSVLEAGLINGRCIEVSVTDTGVGMDPVTLNRIFEPFFTTKEMGHGTGLGLASVYGVIKNHSGQLDVQSKPNCGSSFTFTLPAAKRPKTQCAPPKDISSMAQIEGKILLVDDEPLILKYSHEMIASLGFTVISTQNAHEAIKQYEAHWKEIDLVVLDMVMPQMDGVQLFETLHAINHDIRVIVTTGFSMDSRISDLIACGRHGCLKKPYTRDDLAKAIGGLLNSGPRTTITANAEAV